MVYEWQKWKQGHHVGACMIVDGGRVMIVGVNISKCILDKFWIESMGVEDWTWGLKKTEGSKMIPSFLLWKNRSGNESNYY